MGKFVLKPYQVEGKNFLMAKPYRLLADTMGLGKTVQSIAAFCELGLKKILIVCPKSAKINWQREIKNYSGKDSYVTNAKNQPSSNIIITNYKQLVTKYSLYKQVTWDLIILDEAHGLKEPTSLRTRAIIGKDGVLHNTKRLWALTGTPCPNHAGELWPLMFALGATDFGYEGFVDRYCKVRRRGGRFTENRIVGTDTTHAKELRAMQKKVALRRLKQDVLKDLPPITYQTIVLSTDIEPKLPALFKKQLETEMKLLQEKLGVSINIPDHKMLDALSLMSESISSLRRYHGLKKVKACSEAIAEELESGSYNKIVIFLVHSDVCALAAEYLKKFNPAIITGKTKDRQAQVDKFQNDKSCRVFLGNIQAAGTAITLTAASNLAYFEKDWVPANNEQAAMRIHRIGQKENVLIRTFTLEGLDDLITAALMRKTSELSTFIDS